jgi:FdhE protein
MKSAQDQWIESHPYLRNVAEFQQSVAAAFSALTPAPVPSPDWQGVMDAFRSGAPLLENPAVRIGHRSASADLLLAGTRELLKRHLPQAIMVSADSLRQYLQESSENRVTAINWVQDGESAEPEPPATGLLRLLGWQAIPRALAPVMRKFAELRKDPEWMREYCPVCGALPPLAHLQPEGGQPRMLSCCYCHSLWQYRRIGCPFCKNEDQDRLPIFTTEQEPLFRIDACGECNGYLKTYVGHRDLELHLSDWSTLHLDILAQQHKLERKTTPLFET